MHLMRPNGDATVRIMTGLVALIVVVGCVFGYGRTARTERRAFDALLRHRADDVVSVATSDDGTVDLTAFPYAGDLNSLGMDVYLFYADGKPLFAPEKRQVEGLPALIPVREVRRGGETVVTVVNTGGDTRVLTRAVTRRPDNGAQTTLIVQIGRSEAPLTATLTQQKIQFAFIGIACLFADLIGGGLLIRQLTVPVRRSLAQQQQFVANAAHELRTPLSVIRATTELALMRQRSAEEYEQTLGAIERAVTQTGVVVENLLTLAALDAETEPLETQPTDLAEIAANVVRDAATRYPDTPISSVAKGESTVKGNATLLHRLIHNLVDNACRYNPEGTPVRVALRMSPRWVIVAVSDEGKGIAASEIPHLFERFYRGEAGRKSRQRGSGLGLGLVQQIVTAHGGHVRIVSHIGQGTTVTAFLPRARTRVPEPRRAHRQPARDMAPKRHDVAQREVMAIHRTNADD